MKTCLIVTGGTVSRSVFEAVLLKYNFETVISCDKGLEACHDMGIMPDIVIGDFDSADSTLVDFYRDKTEFIDLDTHKDFTDTHVAVKYVLEHEYDEVVMLGATGTRLDHTMANIGLLKLFVTNNIKAYIIDENNRISMHNKPCSILKTDEYKYVSLVPYTERVTGLSLKGFYYECENAVLSIGESLGISNEIMERQCHIDFSDGLLIVIESHD